jgi:carboxypeptidase C (cathepsin A)
MLHTAQPQRERRTPNTTASPTPLPAQVKVLVYSGQFDLICCALGTERWVQALQWHNADAFRGASRDPWLTPAPLSGPAGGAGAAAGGGGRAAGHTAVHTAGQAAATAGLAVSASGVSTGGAGPMPVQQQQQAGMALAGYKQVDPSGLLTRVLMSDAGHYVPHDQPANALSMLRDFLTS